MDTLIEQGTVGIITGILTTAILFTLKVFWSSKVTPFLASIRYQGVQIEGQWSGFAEITEKSIPPEGSEYRKNERGRKDHGAAHV